jgi:hypothetical protein
MIVAYADESGMHRDGRYPYLAIAGYYGPNQRMEAVRKELAVRAE